MASLCVRDEEQDVVAWTREQRHAYHVRSAVAKLRTAPDLSILTDAELSALSAELLARLASDGDGDDRCVRCWGTVEPALARLGSTTCADCRPAVAS